MLNFQQKSAQVLSLVLFSWTLLHIGLPCSLEIGQGDLSVVASAESTHESDGVGNQDHEWSGLAEKRSVLQSPAAR